MKHTQSPPVIRALSNNNLVLAEEDVTIVYRKSHTQSASQLYRKHRDTLIKKGSRKATVKQTEKALDYIIQNVRETI